MLKRLGHVLLMVALLGATGAHWAVLQSVAWATMLANHARAECLADAFAQTFDGKHPCPLCQQIARSRQAQKKSDWQTGSKQLEFASEPLAFFFCAPADFFLLDERSSSAPLLNQSPPKPPPRAVSA
jgi:Tfp pilus assembly protein PilV